MRFTGFECGVCKERVELNDDDLQIAGRAELPMLPGGGTDDDELHTLEAVATGLDAWADVYKDMDAPVAMDKAKKRLKAKITAKKLNAPPPDEPPRHPLHGWLQVDPVKMGPLYAGDDGKQHLCPKCVKTLPEPVRAMFQSLWKAAPLFAGLTAVPGVGVGVGVLPDADEPFPRSEGSA